MKINLYLEGVNMYYFFMDRNFNLDKYDFDIAFNPKLVKVERDLLNIFLKNVDKNNEFTELKYNFELFQMSYEELIERIKDVKKKSLSIEMRLEDKLIRTLFINFFDVIFFEDEKVIYKLGHEFSIAGNANNFFNRINLIAFLQFDSTYFYGFLKIILKKYKFAKEINFELSLEDLKTQLEISKDKYTRFYDLENKILKPLLFDLNKIDLPVYIEKIKDKRGKGSRIIGVKIKVINILYKTIDKDVNKLLREFSEHIQHFPNAYENIFLLRKMRTYEECKEYIKNNLANLSNENFLKNMKK